MQISARNQFVGTVRQITTGPVNAEVVLALPGGDSLVAVLTRGSVQALGLAVGMPAVALIKASWVTVAVGGGGPPALGRTSARNQLAGVVSMVRPGLVAAELAITLPGGTVVHAVVTQDAVAALGLAPGVPALAVIQASQVVLAISP